MSNLVIKTTEFCYKFLLKVVSKIMNLISVNLVAFDLESAVMGTEFDPIPGLSLVN